MSRYEDPEGTGEYPAGRKRRSLRHRSGRAVDTGNRDASGRSRRGRGRSDPWEPSGRADKRYASQPPSRTRRVLGRHPAVSVLAILATLTITFVSLSAYAAYRNVYDSIHHVTVTSGELGKRPPKLNGSENILIIGSDSRTGYARQVWPRHPGIPVGHVDAAAHLADAYRRDRDQLPPRHDGADLPCERDDNGHPGQQAQPGVLEQLNSTFSYGGPACLWKTLEQVTRIHIDHFVEVDFGGFKSIVNDVGGVPVCLSVRHQGPRLEAEPAGREERGPRRPGPRLRPGTAHRLRL